MTFPRDQISQISGADGFVLLWFALCCFAVFRFGVVCLASSCCVFVFALVALMCLFCAFELCLVCVCVFCFALIDSLCVVCFRLRCFVVLCFFVAQVTVCSFASHHLRLRCFALFPEQRLH